MQSAVEYVTKFATVRMAVTGEPLLAAGRGAVDLLKRNFMDAFGVSRGRVGACCLITKCCASLVYF
jgi:hypothetical protein